MKKLTIAMMFAIALSVSSQLWAGSGCCGGDSPSSGRDNRGPLLGSYPC